jgi:hypothetical protein
MFDETTLNNRHGDDGEILVLFRQWMEASRAYGRKALDDENEEQLGRAIDIEGEIIGKPAAGVADLVVKMYLHLHYDDDDFRIDLAALSGCDAADRTLKRSLLRDMVRFVPGLAPLVADFFNLEPSQAPIESLVAKTESRKSEEGNRRTMIVSRECRELLEEIWAIRPVTNADHREAVRQVIARHPSWFKPEANSSDVGCSEQVEHGMTAAEYRLAETLIRLGARPDADSADRSPRATRKVPSFGP